MTHQPEYPVYIISKERADSRLTSRALEAMGVRYRIVVEPQEYDAYAAVIDPVKILVLPFSNLGQGSIPARNWVWEHAIAEGLARHWILDDNIRGFVRFHRNRKIPARTGAIFRACETFVDRYVNVPLAGMNYRFFGTEQRKATHKPFQMNTRVYSCILLANDAPYRWRGRYNEDTDLSLRVLKDGYCTILFNAFLCNKLATMALRGGNTESLYVLADGTDGRLLMAQSLRQQHPDVVTIARKWGRWQHRVDYRPFSANRLVKRRDLDIPAEPDEHGMRLVARRST